MINEGGVKPNIIPDKCVAEWYIRVRQQLLLRRSSTPPFPMRPVFSAGHESRSVGGVQALTVEDVAELRVKIEGCFKGAAISTGCEISMEWKADTAKTDFVNGCHMCVRRQPLNFALSSSTLHARGLLTQPLAVD